MEATESLTKAKLYITDYLENYQVYYNHPERQKNEDENFLKVRFIIKMIAKESKLEVPSFITNCRTFDEAINELFNDRAETYMQINYVTRLFNEYIDYLEEQELDVKIIKVETEMPKELTFEHLMDALEKCDNRINGGDYSGAVTSAKTLVEGVCKEILHKFSDTIDDNKTDLPALFSRMREVELRPK
ncbi:hypothetical protein ABEV54_05835 [Peribacillus psychrosaccharolyticus]|uniref:hypothetical protein n=1 Tax=Peribacillus psychrosaccharolyticus TaxID=1407 RepID=UPI003D29507B